MNKNKRLMFFEVFRGFIAIIVALLVATIFIFAISKEPLNAIKYLLLSPLMSFRNGAVSFNVNAFQTILAAMIPTIFTGLGICVMFSANEFNLGGEGCVMLSGFISGLSAVYITTGTRFDAVVAIFLGVIASAAIMLIPSLGKIKLKASEMVSSLMINYVIMFVVLHLLISKFADRSKGISMTFPFHPTARVLDMVEGSAHLTYGFLFALIFTVLTALFMYRTRWGYAIRMIGINKEFAKYSGIKVGGIIVLSQAIGGALSGLGGSFEVLGRYDTFLWKELPGYGWMGITIAILAKNNPIFVPLAAFFIAYLEKGCQMMSTYSDVPAEMMDIIQAVIFLFFAAEQFLSRYRQKLVVKSTKEEYEHDLVKEVAK